MKAKLHFIFFLPLIVSIFLAGCFLKSKELKKSQAGNTNCNKYILNFIDGDQPHFLTQKFDYHELSDSEKQELPEDLKNFLIKSLNEDYLSQGYKNICQGDLTDENNSKFESQGVDLNDDGQKEYIIMPREICGRDVRGASSNGDIWVVKKNNNTWEIAGTLAGNCYVTAQDKTNGFYNILTHWHDSAYSGAVTLYKWEKDKDGKYKYLGILGKGYNHQPKSSIPTTVKP